VAPIPNAADTGYFNAEAIRGLEQIDPDPYIAVERPKHHEEVSMSESESEPTAEAAEVSAKETMR
jgi:hypothetical protein